MAEEQSSKAERVGEKNLLLFRRQFSSNLRMSTLGSARRAHGCRQILEARYDIRQWQCRVRPQADGRL